MGAILCVAGALTISLYKGKSFYIGHHSAHHKEISQKVMHNWTRGTVFLVFSIISYATWFMVQVCTQSNGQQNSPQKIGLISFGVWKDRLHLSGFIESQRSYSMPLAPGTWLSTNLDYTFEWNPNTWKWTSHIWRLRIVLNHALGH